MLMDQLLKKVKAALADRAEWQIYDAYDPTPFDKRPDWFLTVGISGTEMQSPFLSGEFLYYPFTASVQVILLAPPDTDVRTLYDSYCREVFSGMLSAGFALQHIRIGSPEELRQFRRIAVKGTFGMDGVFQMHREEAHLVCAVCFGRSRPGVFPSSWAILHFTPRAGNSPVSGSMPSKTVYRAAVM